MFTGLIETLGTVISVDRKGTSVILGIEPDCSAFDVNDGGSVAIDGICLTAERKRGTILIFSAVRETLKRTSLSTCAMGRRVNLERALRLSDRLDGHLVLGHVDGLGSIVGDEDVNGSVLRTIAVPAELQPFMAEKGSVAIDGVSLTIANSTVDTMTVSIIPATLQRTNILLKKSGDLVNLECDVVARYLYRFTKFNSANKSSSLEHDSLITKLERFGF
jgi:riboflavin synthase alpha subunit